MDSRQTVPLNRFDMQAGAKAAYEAFFAILHTEPPVPWNALTAQRQEAWRKILKAGIREAIRAKDQKAKEARKVTRRLRAFHTC